MKEFDRLIQVIDHLLGPEGCPWDREQTMMTLREMILEETCELIEAVDLKDIPHIEEELGDLFFNVLFFCKMGEKEDHFSTEDVLKNIADKLVRRHPHVFGDAKISGTDEFWKQWNAIKATEKGKDKRSSILDGIPKGLPALSRAQKVLRKMNKIQKGQTHFNSEEELGEHLLGVVRQANESGLDSEQALRSALVKLESEFRHSETKNSTQ